MSGVRLTVHQSCEPFVDNFDPNTGPADVDTPPAHNRELRNEFTIQVGIIALRQGKSSWNIEVFDTKFSAMTAWAP